MDVKLIRYQFDAPDVHFDYLSIFSEILRPKKLEIRDSVPFGGFKTVALRWWRVSLPLLNSGPLMLKES
jgi:hypothetical protein